MSEFETEYKEWYKVFIEKYYFQYWKENKNSQYHRSLELYITPECNLKCSYCYLNNFGDELYKPEIRDINNIIKNAEILFNFFDEQKIFIDTIEFFGGESLRKESYDKIFDIIYKYFLKNNIVGTISIPTNVLFVENKIQTESFLDWEKKFKNINSRISFSFSMDGKFCDPISRKAKNKNFKYSNEFYEKVKQFSKRLISKPGFHPMISAENIFYWKENIDWYIDFIMGALDCNETEAINNIYLLEVRNPNWLKEDLLHLNDFNFHFTKKLFKIFNCDVSMFSDFLIKGRINWYSHLFTTIGRGYGCSIQSILCVRLGDLTIVPCHRTSYKNYESGKFIVEKDKIVDLEPINGRIHLAITCSSVRANVVCSHCPINAICAGFCLGANLEFNKSIFLPIPSVCRLEHYKQKSIIKSLDHFDVLDSIIAKLGNSPESIIKVEQIKYLKNTREEITNGLQ
jgi:radical SAM protein with 4Fe4S-binding SPASM domain